MTNEEKREAYLDWINKKTNQDYEMNDLPPAIELALVKLMNTDGTQSNIKSKSQGRRSVTFKDGIPTDILDLIMTERKLRWG